MAKKIKKIKNHLDQRQMPIWNTLHKYSNNQNIYFDVPGHKSKQSTNEMSKLAPDIYKYDRNSGAVLDNLLHPETQIKEAHTLLAKTFGSDEAYILTNGTTQGIHTLIASAIYPGQKILLPRNSHKSVIAGVILAGGRPIWIAPEFNAVFGISNNISLDSIKKAYNANPDAKALMILNPTYFGVVSDLKSIAEFCAEKNIILLTDEAHGAHFIFNKKFPKAAMEVGAHGSALSFHKTLGSLTQASVMLWNESENLGLSSRYIWQWNSILTTTSPNYLLMSSVDATRSKWAIDGKSMSENILNLAKYAREELSKVKVIELLGPKHLTKKGSYDIDLTKLVIKVNRLGYTGFEFYKLLWKDYGIQVEVGEVKVIMALITFSDTKETIDKLVDAIKDIVKNKRKKYVKHEIWKPYINSEDLKRPFTPREAIAKPSEEVTIDNAIGRISSDTIVYYPPGIPLVLPGEAISQKVIDFYKDILKKKARIINSASDLKHMLVLRDIMIPSEGESDE